MSEIASLAPDAPEPLRVLNAEGRRMWVRIWALRRYWIDRAMDIDHIMVLCESIDERELLRESVMVHGDWHDRNALRALDTQITQLLGRLGLNPSDRKALSVGGAGNDSPLAALRTTIQR